MTVSQNGAPRFYGSNESSVPKQERFLEGSIPIAVYGLGKMGLPLAAIYAETTGSVVGVDIDETTVERINQGDCPVENEPGLQSLVEETTESGALWATTRSTGAAAASTIHVVIVPTTLDDQRSPDLTALKSVISDIGSGLDRGDFVIIESTVPPGTCRGCVRSILESESNLPAGEFGLAFCPERTASGRALRDIRGAYPKIVGGFDDESTLLAELIYKQITDNRIIPVSDITVAECVKLFEGVYRDVNIALANELARFADEIGIDGLEAIEAANTQPYSAIHDPGAGVGGHCIPYYPYFLIDSIQDGHDSLPLLETARSVNESMPAYAATKLIDGLRDHDIDLPQATVAVLGVTYRPGVRETRESPAYPIVDRLHEVGLSVVIVDPILEEFPGFDARPTTIDRLSEHDIDGAILVTAHEEFDRISWDAFDPLVVVDGRDALEIEDARHAVYSIGRG